MQDLISEVHISGFIEKIKLGLEVNYYLKGELQVIYIGALPSNVYVEDHPGHMWIGWLGDHNEYHFRGYFPRISEIPVEYRPLKQWKRFFLKNAVTGIRRIDYRAMEITRRYPRQLHKKIEEIADVTKKYKLEILCWMPSGCDSVFEGKYSWNEKENASNNCSSWVVKIANNTMGAKFLPCTRPKRLGIVIREIFNGDINEH